MEQEKKGLKKKREKCAGLLGVGYSYQNLSFLKTASKECRCTRITFTAVALPEQHQKEESSVAEMECHTKRCWRSTGMKESTAYENKWSCYAWLEGSSSGSGTRLGLEDLGWVSSFALVLV